MSFSTVNQVDGKVAIKGFWNRTLFTIYDFRIYFPDRSRKVVNLPCFSLKLERSPFNMLSCFTGTLLALSLRQNISSLQTLHLSLSLLRHIQKISRYIWFRRSHVSWFNWWVSFAPLFQCWYFCESSCLFYLRFNFDFYVSKIIHLWARNLPRKPNN